MFAAMTLILVVVGWVVGFLFGNVWTGMWVMLAIAVVMNLASYFFSKKMALSMNRVRLVTYDEEPRLYSIVQRLADRAGLPMPEVGISEMPMPNAFATGRGPKDAAVVATRPLLNMLTDEELEGVMAHELSHVKNRDILVMSVASTMAAMVSYITRMAVWSSIFSDEDNGGLGFAIALLADVTMPIAAMLVQLGVSRNREYLADESGARLTGKPMALASALRTIESGCSTNYNTYDNPSAANMWISNPFGKKRMSGLVNLFRTHPSTEDRIERLKKLDTEINGITHY
ncbi:MAG: zinc metalloprotease HtpX [Candidatus Methanomethylophilaceae archaeon]|nr:zinc metalloprotease HtpX [Candidatus Methanomethylophilaceae archaeon]